MPGMKCNDMKIKVVFFSHYSTMYGANRSLLELIQAIRKYNIEAIVITPNYGELNKKLNEIKVMNKAFPFYYWTENISDKSTLTNSLKKFVKKCIGFVSGIRIAKWLKIIEVDIIHTNTSVINIGAKVAKRLNKPHIWHIREYGEEDYNIQFEVPMKAAINFMEDNSHQIIFISNDLNRKYKRHIKNENKYQVIYNGAEKDKYYYKRERDEFFDEKLKIILCGLIHQNKNQIEVIEAIALLEKSYLEKIEINIIGDGDTTYLEILKNYVRHNGLSENIIFHGYIDNITDFIKSCHIAIVPSKREAFGRVTVEYMLAGNAVIVSNTGANTEIVDNEVNGLVYELGNKEELSKKLSKYIDDRAFLYKCSTNGQNKALDCFISDINAKNIDKVYRSI